MALLTTGTVLELSGIDLRDYSARQLNLQITPLSSGPLIRDVNGLLHDATIEQFRKYQFVVSCTDVTAPRLSGVYKGLEVTITILPNTGLETDDSSDPPDQLSFNCMVLAWQSAVDEWKATTGWSITLLEK